MIILGWLTILSICTSLYTFIKLTSSNCVLSIILIATCERKWTQNINACTWIQRSVTCMFVFLIIEIPVHVIECQGNIKAIKWSFTLYKTTTEINLKPLYMYNISPRSWSQYTQQTQICKCLTDQFSFLVQWDNS